MKVLVLGGSGFLSGTVVRAAVFAGHEVWAVTRGQRALLAGVRGIVADRKERAGFLGAIAGVGERWDLVIDCIGFTAEDARQDVEAFAGRADHLVFVSTDFVLDPEDRPWRVDEMYDRFNTQTDYGRGKREAEVVLLGAADRLAVTIVRPCHIYGPGSLLGCLPRHGRDVRLVEKLLSGEPLELVGGGHFLQQPVFAMNLARMLLSVAGNPATHGQVYMAAGPDVVASREYYRILAEALGVPLRVEEAPIAQHLAEKPGDRSFCCHRVYAMDKAERDGLAVPATPLAEGLRMQLASLRGSQRVEGGE